MSLASSVTGGVLEQGVREQSADEQLLPIALNAHPTIQSTFKPLIIGLKSNFNGSLSFQPEEETFMRQPYYLQRMQCR